MAMLTAAMVVQERVARMAARRDLEERLAALRERFGDDQEIVPSARVLEYVKEARKLLDDLERGVIR
jgi:hypothetical protein